MTAPLRIVFLDMDGVLNSTRWMNGLPADSPRRRNQIDPAAVGVLREIVTRTGAKIVVSSTWRKNNTKEEMAEHLRKNGLEAEVIGLTPDLFGSRYERLVAGRFSSVPYYRGDEIQAWLTEHGPVAGFVILDDDSDMAHLMDRLVHTSCDDGLLWEHIEPVITQLMRAVET